MKTGEWFVGIVGALGLSWATLASIGAPLVVAQGIGETKLDCGQLG